MFYLDIYARPPISGVGRGWTIAARDVNKEDPAANTIAYLTCYF